MIKENEREAKTMCEFWDRIIAEGKSEGKIEQNVRICPRKNWKSN